jgi:hypothetical protein
MPSLQDACGDGPAAASSDASPLSANVNDTVPADGLICGDEATVYAEAYDSKARRVRLKEMDIRDGIMAGTTAGFAGTLGGAS